MQLISLLMHQLADVERLQVPTSLKGAQMYVGYVCKETVAEMQSCPRHKGKCVGAAPLC
jgi:hypothetical protein